MIAVPPAGTPPIGIAGLGTHLPRRILTSAELAPSLGVDEDWIVSRSGIRERRLAEDHESAVDLAVPAARAALTEARVGAADLDLLLVATATPDFPAPATAVLVAHELGARAAAAYDLSAASTGFVYAAAQAWAAVAAGLARRVLVVCTEVLSRIVRWDDRDTAILFGDGAAAVVVTRVAQGGFLGFELGADGSGASDILVPAGGSRHPASAETAAQRQHTIVMNGGAVYRFSTRATTESVTRLLAACGIGVADVDVYAPHQSNLRLVEASARRLGIPPERVALNLDAVGNTASASIPLVLDDARRQGRLAAGDTVLVTAVGAGLTWGSAVLRWSPEAAA